MQEFEELKRMINKYNKEEINKIIKAFKFAKEAHSGQKRDSGEDYIIHPINVCINLAKFNADGATLVAGMLHDVVEDTKYTLKDVEDNFGKEVADLVLGVTKISNIHFSSSDEAYDANIRRIITSLNKDVRIIIIKLCDRLHNMRTLNYKSKEKQPKYAMETLSIYVPLAYFIGAYRLKCELEDICLYYLDKDLYEQLELTLSKVAKDYKKCIEETEEKIGDILKENNITFNIRTKIINVYKIYKKLKLGYKLEDIHDLVNVKIIVSNIDECYKVLGLVHKVFPPFNSKFKDYIAVPKTNMYSSLHTTVFGPKNHLIQLQIKTQEMDDINTFGLASYWKKYKAFGSKKMQEELLKNYQFISTISLLNESIENDKLFLETIKLEIFTNNVYVYSASGKIVELPNNSTPIDYAYKLNKEVGNHIKKCFVNGKEVPLDYKLKNKDRVIVIIDKKIKPKKYWFKMVETTRAKRCIEEYFNSK